MNTTATADISDAGAAPVGHQLQRLPTADRLPAYQHRSCGALCPSGSWYQFILLGGQRHVHVNNLPKVVTW